MIIKRYCPLWICILLFLSFLSKRSNGQNFPFREYGVQDGLAQSQANVINQDSRGFLWIPTRNGLSRFDGVEFVNYFSKDGLPVNFVLTMLEDNDGKIWALTNEGLSLYTGTEFKFFDKRTDSAIMPLLGFEYGINSENEIFLLIADTVKPRIIKFHEGIYSDYSSQFTALDTLKVRGIAFDRENNELLIIDRRSQLWSWKYEALVKLSSDKFDFLSIENNNIILLRDDIQYEYGNGEITLRNSKHLQGEPEIASSGLKSGIVDFFDGKQSFRIHLPFAAVGVMKDNEENLWFSSENNIRRLLSTAFTFYNEVEKGIENSWTMAIDRNGHVWFGSLQNKLVEFDGITFKERNEFKRLFSRPIAFYKGSRKLSNGDVWFSTNGGVLVWNGNTFSRYKGIPENTQVCYIYEDPDNKTVMLGTNKGLFVIENGKVSSFPEYNGAELGVIEGITKDNEGIYWFSGHKGVYKFDGKLSTPVKEELLPMSYTYTIEKDSFGGIWVTSEEGLFTRSRTGGKFTPGLPDEINKPANTISVMDNKHILVGRISDICVIDLDKYYGNQKNYYRVYDKTDGFTGNDCLDNGIIKDDKGRFWILTSDQVVVFDPSKIKINPTPPTMHITGFYYETDSLTWKPVEDADFFYGIPENLHLERHQNTLKISFAGISFTNPEKVQYQYMLEGFDKKWSKQSAKRFIEYEKLTPGFYTFRVKAANADGVEAQPLTFRFRIIPAFWQTTLFKIAVVFVLLASAVFIPLRILKRIQDKKFERERLKSELSHLQMNSVLKQFDPHFTFNVISSVGSLIMKGEKEIAYEYITKLSGLLRTVLNEGSLVIKPLSVELDFVRKYCELQKLRFKDRFNYNFFIEESVDLNREIPKMTIQTFVENAVKHGIENRKEGGMVDIQIRNLMNDLEIRIIDDGIGRAAASKLNSHGTGNGLKIITGLFAVMNNYNERKSEIGIVDLENNKEYTGTEVRIVIPENYRFEILPGK